MRRRLSCAPGPTLSTAPGNTTPPIGHARAQRQPRPRAPTADSRSTRRHPPPGRRRRARIRPATAPIALHPADSVRIRQVRGRGQPVEVSSRARGRGGPLVEEENETLITEPHKGRNTRLTCTDRCNDLAGTHPTSRVIALTHADGIHERRRRHRKAPGNFSFLGALTVKPSAGLAVRRRLVAARAVLRQFETIRRVTTVLLGDVVALLALRAGQSDLGANVLGLACHGCFPRLVSSLARPVGSKNW